MTSQTILIIDDDLALLDLLKTVLSPTYRVLTASDGLAGLNLARSQKPALILLDMMMPRMDGIETLKMLRQEKYHIPVIFMTAAGSEYTAAAAFRLGVTDYLSKPFDPADLQRIIYHTFQKQAEVSRKEGLARAETVRQLTITLSHHIKTILPSLTVVWHY